MKNTNVFAVMPLVLWASAAVLSGQNETPANPDPGKPADAKEADANAGDAKKPVPTSSVVGREKSSLILNQHLTEGWHAGDLNLDEPDAVFEHVFDRLPDEVTIYPTENYYYWKLIVDGRQVWGNIRLPTGRRDRGVVSFGNSEFLEFPTVRERKEVSRSKYFTKADGVVVKKNAEFNYTVTYGDRSVVFHLNQLPQVPPKAFKLGQDEQFIERTFDESGLQFFLLFNTKTNYFFWVLNEEVKTPEHFKKLADDVMVGRRTGFVFWVDAKHQKRKVLATIRKISVTRNDYYDGPFDQLADNYVDEVNVRKYMELAIPSIKGRIDKYGYYMDKERPTRVALSNYGTYYTYAEAIQFVKNAKKAPDPYRYISRGGVPLPADLKTKGKIKKRSPLPGVKKPTPKTPAPLKETEKSPAS